MSQKYNTFPIDLLDAQHDAVHEESEISKNPKLIRSGRNNMQDSAAIREDFGLSLYSLWKNLYSQYKTPYGIDINYPTSRNKLELICKESGLTIDINTLGLFIAYNNDLVCIAHNCKVNSHDCIIAHNNLEAFSNLAEKIHKIHASSDELSIYEYTLSKGDVNTSRLPITTSSLSSIISQLYPDIDISILTNSYLSSSDSILLLYGPPGTGKTSFIKRAMYEYLTANPQSITDAYSRHIAYSKDYRLMSESRFWVDIRSHNYKMLILDDLDIPLVDRRGNEKEFISNLLSFSDGIFTNDNSCKVIITTNQEIDEIDEAIIRPGRCFDFIYLHPMSYSYALELWVDLFKKDEDLFKSYFSNPKDEVYQSSFMDLYRNIDNKTHRGYIKDKNKSYFDIYSKLKDLNITVNKDKNNKFI